MWTDHRVFYDKAASPLEAAGHITLDETVICGDLRDKVARDVSMGCRAGKRPRGVSAE